MIYYKIEMHHNEKTFESLSRMQYDLFCASNRITRTILSILFIAGGIINLSEWWGILLAAYGCYLTTSTYSSANHTAHKLAEQIKKSAQPPEIVAVDCVKNIFVSCSEGGDDGLIVVNIERYRRLRHYHFFNVRQK